MSVEGQAGFIIGKRGAAEYETSVGEGGVLGYWSNLSVNELAWTSARSIALLDVDSIITLDVVKYDAISFRQHPKFLELHYGWWYINQLWYFLDRDSGKIQTLHKKQCFRAEAKISKELISVEHMISRMPLWCV